MKNLKNVCCSLLLLTSFSLFPLGIANAMTDDTGVIGGLNKDVDVYNYLNTYKYHLWKPEYKGLYASEDNLVLVDTFENFYHQMILTNIFILGGNYETDKGIKVGDSVEDIRNAYGEISSDDNEHANTGTLIEHSDDTYYQKLGYSGYNEIYYRDAKNSAIYFIINKYTQKIVLIMYQENRHGSSLGLASCMSCNLLPRLV